MTKKNSYVLLDTVEEDKNKHDNLVKLGIENFKAWEFANTRKGYWNDIQQPYFIKVTHE